jgi:nucleoside recognition membrane protein YjiH
MGILVIFEAPHLLPRRGSMHATFFQKVIICAIAGFLAAALLEWGRMFVTGADDALNKGYKHTAPGVSLKSKP